MSYRGGGGYNRGGGRGGGGYQGRGGYDNRGGNWGGRGGGGRGNRFEALDYDDRNDQGAGGGRGGGRGQGGGGYDQQHRGGGGRGGYQQGRQQQEHNQEVPPDVAVPADCGSDRPPWPFSCYAHAKGGQNDLTGDVSFEEVRWMQLQEAQAGKDQFIMRSEWNAAVAAKQKEFDQMIRAARSRSRLPSQGGAPIREHNAWVQQMCSGAYTATATASSTFGQPQAPVQASQPTLFGKPLQPQQPALSAFGTGNQSLAFGQPTSTQPTLFGQPIQTAPQPFQNSGGSTLFGQPQAAAQQPSGIGIEGGGFGQTAIAQPFQTAAGMFGQSQQQPTALGGMLFGKSIGQSNGTGMTQQTSSIFGIPQQPQQSVLAGSVFGQPAAPGGFLGSTGASTGFGMLTGGAPQAGGSFGQPDAASATMGGQAAIMANGSASHATSDLEVYRQPTFVRGKIPDEPPPLAVC